MSQKSGRPVRFSKGLAEKICMRLAQGERWSEMSREEGMPGYVTFYTWMETKPGFASMVAAARRMAADFCLDQALKVAEGASKDTATADRLKVDTLMKRAAQATADLRGDRSPGEGGVDARRVEIVFYARHFERYTDSDGRLAVREVIPLSRMPVIEADQVQERALLARRLSRKPGAR
jgi:hypothetical protein